MHMSRINTGMIPDQQCGCEAYVGSVSGFSANTAGANTSAASSPASALLVLAVPVTLIPASVSVLRVLTVPIISVRAPVLTLLMLAVVSTRVPARSRPRVPCGAGDRSLFSMRG